MTITDDLKKQAAKSIKWKIGIVAAIAIAAGYFAYTGNKETMIKLVSIAGEVIAVPEDTQILAGSSPVTVQVVSESTFISATVPNTPAK